jgi:hypothetical protein
MTHRFPSLSAATKARSHKLRAFALPSAFGFVAGAAFTLGVACSSNEAASDVRVLAKNVRLALTNAAAVRTAHAGDTDPRVDPNLIVRAENVVYERSARADLNAEDVQGALESITVKLETVLPGTWAVANVSEDGTTSTGRIRIDERLEFEVLEGGVRAINVTRDNVDPAKPRTVSVTAPRVPLFRFSTYMDETKTSSNLSGVFTLVADARPDRIVLANFNAGVSVLTREDGR